MLSDLSFGKVNVRMKKKLTHNLFLKILSVIFAFMLWIIVVIVNDPYKTVIISGVPITIINEEEITSQGIGKIYSVVSPQNKTVSIKVYGQRSKVDNLKAEDIQAIVDFSEVSSVGAVYITVAEPEGITILSKTPEMMKIDVEALKERTFEVKTKIVGSVASGYMINSHTIETKEITVIAPESIMQKLASAQVQIDVSGSTDDITETVDIRLYDASGKVIDYKRDPNIKVSDSTTVVSVETLMTKEVGIEIETAGKVGDNYKLTGMTQNRDTVTLKGHKDVLTYVNNIVISEESRLVDLSNLTTSKEVIVDIRGLLPEGVTFVDDGERFVTVGLTIEPIVEKAFTINLEDINLVNLAEDLELDKENSDQSVMINLRGLEKDLNLVDIKAFIPYIDVAECEAGINICRVYLNIPSNAGVTSVGAAIIDINLKQVIRETITPPHVQSVIAANWEV